MLFRLLPTTTCVARILEHKTELNGFNLPPGVSFYFFFLLLLFFLELKHRNTHNEGFSMKISTTYLRLTLIWKISLFRTLVYFSNT